MIKYIQQKNIDFDLLKNHLEESLSANQFTNRGPAKHRLENELNKLFNINENKRVVCVTNGTLALHALFFLYEKKYNKQLKWVTPSFTFPSSVVGKFKSDILDIDPNTYTLPLTEEIIKSYDGFIITNLFGTYPKNINSWIEECKRNNKILIFDNASSPMSTVGGININNLGDSAFGSLHHTKYLGFGEGGFVVVNKEDYDELNTILGFGFTGTTIKRKYDKYSSNYKMPDTIAAFILQHLEIYDMKRHKEIQAYLVDEVSKIKNIQLFNYQNDVVYGNLPILYDKKINHLFFKDFGVEANKYYYPLKEQKNSMYVYNRIVNLPLHAGLTDYELEIIISVLKKSIR